MTVYLLGDIRLASEIPLPELSLWRSAAAAPPEINVRLGSVPTSLPHGEIDPECFVTASEYLLSVPGVARYLVSEGREIVVQPAESALALDVRAYLLGTIFSALCQQRGLLPLHASAIHYGGGVIAFLGHAGAGKSSLAANLGRRGFSLVADDICLVDAREEGPAMVMPTAPWLKLWRSSLDQLGMPAKGLAPIFSEDDKYRVPFEQTRERLPIRKLIFLERGDGAGEAEAAIKQVSRLHALPLLMNLTHQAYLLQASGKRKDHFLHCGRVAAQADAYRLTRPWGFTYMDSTVDSIERLLRMEQD